MKAGEGMTDRAGDDRRALLRRLFDGAVRAVSAETIMPATLPYARGGRTVIVAIGKAAAPMMATAIARNGMPDAGLVVTRHHHLRDHRFPAAIEVIEAGHPVPDEHSVAAATRALALAADLRSQDRLLLLLSGGGSALAAAPVAGVALADKQAVTQALLRSGATIGEINTVRKRLSRIKGGRLALAAGPALTTTYLISDVPGDDPAAVASGPTIADGASLADARAIIAAYDIDLPPGVARALDDPANEPPPSDALGLAGCVTEIVARARDALDAATGIALDEGFAVTNLGDRLQAEARHLGASHAALARRLATDGRRVILSGGETTVTVANPAGRGGRNLEYLLGLAIALDGDARISALACDTDGIDGTEDAAGAIVLPDTLARARALGLDPADYLARNDAYTFFATLGDLVVTGPTLTNVNDFRAILIDPDATATATATDAVR